MACWSFCCLHHLSLPLSLPLSSWTRHGDQDGLTRQPHRELSLSRTMQTGHAPGYAINPNVNRLDHGIAGTLVLTGIRVGPDPTPNMRERRIRRSVGHCG